MHGAVARYLMSRSIAVVFPHWMQEHGHLGEEHAFRTFEHVVRAVTALSPLVEVQDIGTVVLSARGPSRYFGGDNAVAQKLHQICLETNMGSAFGVGIADSRFAALAAAHLAVSRQHPCVIDTAIAAEFIAALPVASLSRVGGITPDSVDLFQRLGLGTCGGLLTVGEAALIDRFGVEGKRVYLLVSGDEVQHLAPGAPPSDFACSIEFESPLANAAHVVSAARDTIDAMVNAIAGHGQQCVRLLITCDTDHAESTSRIWGEPRGFSAAVTAQRLLYQLEGWLTDSAADPDAPTSGVIRVEFMPLESREVLVSQPLLWGGSQENTERAARAASMAMAVNTSVQVTVPRWEGGRDMATVYSRVPLSLVDITNPDASEQRVHTGDGIARQWSGSVPSPSPASVAVEPPLIRVVDAGGSEVGVTGRHELNTVPSYVEVGSQKYDVVRVAGPWPLEERWWDPRRKRRQVRMQVLVRHPRRGIGVFLVGLENQQWTLLARYD